MNAGEQIPATIGDPVNVRGEGSGTVTAVDGNVTVALDDGRSCYVEASDVMPIVPS